MWSWTVPRGASGATLRGMVDELADQPGLADAGLADHDDRRGVPSLERPVDERREGAQLPGPADEGTPIVRRWRT